MGSWSQSRYGWRLPNRGAWRPPLPPGNHGNEHCSVPLWEREFCSSVGNISWQSFCENKLYVSILVFSNLEKWDDSGALENFQIAKTRFWANYHGRPYDIPLPDPDMYIDDIGHHCKVDPELVADLDKVWSLGDSDNNSTPVLEWPNAGVDNKFTLNQSENWDVYMEKPAAVNEWDLEPNPGSSATWGRNYKSSSKWGNNFGWGAPLRKPSQHRWCKNQYASNNRYENSYGGSNNKRYFKQTNKQRDHDEGFQRSRCQDPKGKKMEWRPVDNRASQNVQGLEGSS